MKVVFHKDFYQVYTSDPASAKGRMESIINVIKDKVKFIDAKHALEEDIALVHTTEHINYVKKIGLYSISSLAAGAAMQSAEIGLTEPCFALIRPPGHHASRDSCWGFCFFNNMAVSIESLYKKNKIKSAFILDFDLHFGDGNVNILSNKEYIDIYNPEENDRLLYINNIKQKLNDCNVDIIGISAGFDNHADDWGGLLLTQDYFEIGQMVRKTAKRSNCGFFAILEGGYNHNVLGQNVMALLDGLGDIHRNKKWDV